MDNTFQLDMKCIPDELKLLLEIISDKDDFCKPFASLEFSKGIDWNLFLKLAIHHRIYPLVYLNIKKLNYNFIPSNIVQSISQLYKKNTFQMLHLSAVMEQINNICFENEIRVLFLKGPVLAKELYGDISLRTSIDLDILISINDLEKMERLLVESGYEKDDYIETVLNDWKWRHHHITFFHSKSGIKLEVHWRLNPGPGSEPTFNELWERRKLSSLTNNQIYLLGNEDLFLFLATHGSRHGWSRLRWLVDIDRVLKQGFDWKKNLNLLKKYHYLQIGGQSLFLASQLLNTPLNKEFKKYIRGRKSTRLAQEAVFYLERMVNLHTYPIPEDIANYHKRHLFSLMSTYQKVLFIISFLYPYPEDAKTLQLPETLHFLYFPLRPFLWAWRKIKSHALT